MTVSVQSVDRAMHQAKKLARKGKLAEAQQVYEAILERFPGNKRATEGLQGLLKSKPAGRGLTREQADAALALYSSGQLDKALAQTAALVAQHPNVPFLHNLLGAIHLALERPGDAEACFRNAIALRPADPEGHSNLGNALKALGCHDAAIASLQAALSLDPDNVTAHNNIANTLTECGRSEEAIGHLQQALALKPDMAEAHSNLGNILQTLGRFDEAVSHYEHALAISPDRTTVHRNLSTIKTFEEGDAQLADMETLLQAGQGDRAAKVDLNFALGKAYDDTGDADAAFERFAEGNRLRRAELGYRPERDVALFAHIRTVFDAAAAGAPTMEQSGHKGPTPIFVVGMPRSGTSLIEQILASHPDVYGAGELAFMDRAMAPLLGGETTAPAGTIGEVRRSYLSAITALGIDESHVVDKMPLNFRWIGFIALAMPEAKIINVERDAVATGWSIFRHYFPSRDLGFAFDLDDIAHYTELRDELMAFWRERLPGRILDFDYETLTESQERETRRLLDHCDLDWDARCLDFHRTKRVVRTASAEQVRRKLYRGSSAAWKRYADHLGPLLKAA